MAAFVLSLTPLAFLRARMPVLLLVALALMRAAVRAGPGRRAPRRAALVRPLRPDLPARGGGQGRARALPRLVLRPARRARHGGPGAAARRDAGLRRARLRAERLLHRDLRRGDRHRALLRPRGRRALTLTALGLVALPLGLPAALRPRAPGGAPAHLPRHSRRPVRAARGRS
ncbi:MAG: hypothetical protein MZV64_25850 [Ignavibacteriales bacterium]|nr:hypothetical protein [Ignavibacteriales bacterium]